VPRERGSWESKSNTTKNSTRNISTLRVKGSRQDTVGQNNQEARQKYCATYSFIHSFTCTAHFDHSLARRKVNDYTAIYSVLFSILAHSAGYE